MSLRLKLSFVWAVVTAVLVLVGCMLLFLLVMAKRSSDLDLHLKNLAHQAISIPQIRSYLQEQPAAPKEEEVQAILSALLQNDPFVEELTIIDQFDKVLFRVSQSVAPSEKPAPASNALPLASEHPNGQPLHLQESRESYIDLSTVPNEDLGRLKVRWRPEATVKFSRILKVGIAYITVVSFLASFFLTFFFLLRAYSREYHRMTRSLSLIVGGDYSQRLDTQLYSKGFNDIGVYINRVLSDMEEERKKSQILDSTLRQAEKSCSDYRKSLNERSHELETLRRDLRQGLYILFDLLWNGLIIIDEEFFVHYMNDQAERLLRFAKFDESTLVDERLRKCLSPLVRAKSSERVDDLCVWSQRTIGHSVSCRVRAASIPTGDGTRLFFVLLKEESGFPKYHGSTYFSERLVLDVLAHSHSDPSLVLASADHNYSRNELELRFRESLRKIEIFRDLEEGRIGPVTSVRLPLWLRDHFKTEEFYSANLNIDAQTVDLDIALHIPEKLLSELVDSMIYIISQVTASDGVKKITSLAVRPSVDSRGKPVVTFTLPRFDRRHLSLLQDVIEERVSRISESPSESPFTLDDLEQDITLSIYRLIRRLLRVQVECVFSENKQLATLRMVIENHSFPPPLAETSVAAESESSDPVRNLVREFLSGL